MVSNKGLILVDAVRLCIGKIALLRSASVEPGLTVKRIEEVDDSQDGQDPKVQLAEHSDISTTELMDSPFLRGLVDTAGEVNFLDLGQVLLHGLVVFEVLRAHIA